MAVTKRICLSPFHLYLMKVISSRWNLKSKGGWQCHHTDPEPLIHTDFTGWKDWLLTDQAYIMLISFLWPHGLIPRGRAGSHYIGSWFEGVYSKKTRCGFKAKSNRGKATVTPDSRRQSQMKWSATVVYMKTVDDIWNAAYTVNINCLFTVFHLFLLHPVLPSNHCNKRRPSLLKSSMETSRPFLCNGWTGKMMTQLKMLWNYNSW